MTQRNILNEEVHDLQEVLVNFRSAVHCAAARHSTQTGVPRFQTHPSSFSLLRIAAAAIAVVILVLAPYRIHHQQQQLEERERQDIQLLEEIDEQVSSTVPDALEPLANLISSGQPQDAH
jgi:hypothetical protein